MTEPVKYETAFKEIRDKLGNDTDPKTAAILSGLEIVAAELHVLNVAGSYMEGIKGELNSIATYLERANQ